MLHKTGVRENCGCQLPQQCHCTDTAGIQHNIKPVLAFFVYHYLSVECSVLENQMGYNRRPNAASWGVQKVLSLCKISWHKDWQPTAFLSLI